MTFEFSAQRVAISLTRELYAAGLNRGEVSCLEFVMVNRSATLTGSPRIDLDHWVETENERLKRDAADGFLEAPQLITVLELGRAFLSLKKKGMAVDDNGSVHLPVIEKTPSSTLADCTGKALFLPSL